MIPRTPGPVEREERRVAQRAEEHPSPPGLLPAAALDGKAQRGARTPTGQVFLVGAIDHASGAVLGQTQVPDKRGEGTAARTLVSQLAIPGLVFTMDALHTTKKTAHLIAKTHGAHYVLVLKGNQPLARTAAQALLNGTDTEWAQTTDVEDDRGHGRTERRTLRSAPADDTLFPGARQVFRLRRDSGELDGAWTAKEIVFGVTSLTPDLAGPAQLNHYERAHWGIENKIH
ncbi:ISAs1 family transposase [Streptomyces sp. H27-G5]|uniref:ISAs1 family transposase n=1 Tax=Streptomyces sp. H27-G5 TaxID=2996698 RepID=UPI00226F6651|nr:ISAs1 family transposase [Streptomyces sp. H27-G5]MCY0924511.1 ISAs1 family transposase [Streptomyces sp. H27-G5]